jgi:hypothetical protein
MSRRLLFVVNIPRFFLSHRLPIALAARDAGYEVHVATSGSDPENVARIRELGLTVQASELDREFSRLAIEHRTEPRRIAELVRDQGTLPVLVGDVLRRKTIDAVLDAAEVAGGPDDATLRRLGLLSETPEVPEVPEVAGASAAYAPTEDAPTEDAPAVDATSEDEEPAEG